MPPWLALIKPDSPQSDLKPRQRIGNSNGLLAPPRRLRAPPAAPLARACHPASRGSLPERGAAHFGWCWTGDSGWVKVAPQGCPWGTTARRATWEAEEGEFKRDCTRAEE